MYFCYYEIYLNLVQVPNVLIEFHGYNLFIQPRTWKICSIIFLGSS